MSMMGGNESDILADASELLEGGEDDLEDDVTGTELDSPDKSNETKTEEAAAPKKKVSIKRDSALPVVV